MGNLYKFLGESVADVLLNGDKFGIKFSNLSDYNDPYEFFLTIDYNVPADMLATYKEAINMVVKSPATCFAKSPAILPMWAHYAGNSNGFALEIDEDELTNHIKEVANGEFGFGDIDYQDTPHEGMTERLAMAARRCKPRDMYFLYTAIKSAAYFTKTSDWSYERERRLIINERHLKNIAGNLIFIVPKSCIKSIIVGQKAKQELKEKIKLIAEKANCKVLELTIGKSSATPYFRTTTGVSYDFNGEFLSPTRLSCASCKEPIIENNLCSWCAMTENEENSAASRNPFRMFSRAGILENYVIGMDEITFKSRD